jgi:hypothetical protein
MTEQYSWQKIFEIPSKGYRCGYCGESLASEKGFVAFDDGSTHVLGLIYICHFCNQPTFFDCFGMQWPGVAFGRPVNDIPDKAVQDLYEEARRITGVGGYTAAVLICRKLLMHIAVTKGAPVGQTFISYVEFLSANHFVPPDAQEWVDHIRTKGNEANHEILVMTKDDAEDLLSFIEMLLKIIFEFPATAKKRSATP